MTSFYAVEATIHRGFLDPVGPADQGWLAQPNLALCEIETGAAAQTVLRASDSGYRTLATDPGGVLAYPPSIAQAFQIDVAANLDPVKSAVAAAWGSVTFANLDHSMDALIAGWQSDGQMVRILRGDKTWDAARGIWLDPAYASLVQIFQGVMGPWVPDLTGVTVALRDASYYLERQIQRSLFGGTGGLDGPAALKGVPKPLAIGGTAASPIMNVPLVAIDPANLIYELAEDGGLNPVFPDGIMGTHAFGYGVSHAYDGGAALGGPAQTNTALESFSTGPGGSTFDNFGHLQIGTLPTFTLTADLVPFSPLAPLITFTPALSILANLALSVLRAPGICALPPALVAELAGAPTYIDTYGVDTAATAAVLVLQMGVFVASGEQIDGIGLMQRLLASSGALLVPGRDGLLRLLVLATIPAGAAPVLTFDDTTITDIKRTPLPATIDPPPFRMRLGYNRNWSVQAGNMAGSVSAARLAYVAAPARVVTGVAVPSVPAGSQRLTDPVVVGEDGSSIDQISTQPQAVVNNMIALWGTQRYLYEVTVPSSVGLALDWASVVSIVTNFDGLGAGKLGQIVGWRFASTDATTMFRVLV